MVGYFEKTNLKYLYNINLYIYRERKKMQMEKRIKFIYINERTLKYRKKYIYIN